jgi:hypothetical protein
MGLCLKKTQIKMKPNAMKTTLVCKKGLLARADGSVSEKTQIKMKPNVTKTLGYKKVLRNCDSHRRKLEGVTF